MDYVVPIFVALAILRGVVSLAVGMYYWVFGDPDVEKTTRNWSYIAFLRRVVPLLIAALLGGLYFGNILRGYSLLILGAFLYWGEILAAIFLNRRTHSSE